MSSDRLFGEKEPEQLTGIDPDAKGEKRGRKFIKVDHVPLAKYRRSMRFAAGSYRARWCVRHGLCGATHEVKSDGTVARR